MEAARVLLKGGANPNKPGSCYWTPLHVAAAHNSKEMAQLLLHNGANPNLADRDGQTPLHRAALWNSDGVAQLLLKYKADPNVANKNGRTPLHVWDGGAQRLLNTVAGTPDVQTDPLQMTDSSERVSFRMSSGQRQAWEVTQQDQKKLKPIKGTKEQGGFIQSLLQQKLQLDLQLRFSREGDQLLVEVKQIEYTTTGSLNNAAVGLGHFPVRLQLVVDHCSTSHHAAERATGSVNPSYDRTRTVSSNFTLTFTASTVCNCVSVISGALHYACDSMLSEPLVEGNVHTVL